MIAPHATPLTTTERERSGLRLALLLLLAIGLLGLASCKDKQDQWAEITPTPLLYKITSSDGEEVGWMLGTIHALPADVEWRNARIDRVLETADSLMLEVAEMGDPAIARTFANLSTTPGIGPLPPRVSPDLREPLDEMVELSGIAPARFHNTETWAAAILLARVGAYGDPANGVDRFVLAQFSDRPVTGLESAREQLAAFDTLSLEDQRVLLEGTIEEWLIARENPGRLTRAWLAGDEATLLEATSQGIMADKEVREALLVDRNKRWMPAIIAQLESPNRPLIAVGTAHLIGPDGLATMLEAQGYTVEPIR